MKQPIRYFSIGLLSSTVVLMLFFLFIEDQQASLEDVPIETLVDSVKDQGYHVLSEDEYISLSVAGETTNEESQKGSEAKNQEDDQSTEQNEASKEEDKEDNKAENEEQVEKEPSVITYTLTVEPNMLGPDISKRLSENKIIEEPDKFSRYLEDEGYSRYIQLGDHTLTSDMSYFEIAEAIAK